MAVASAFDTGIPNLTEATDVLRRKPQVGATRPRHRRARHFVAFGLFDLLENFAELEVRIAALPTKQDRSDAFEVFAEAYLATQKVVGAEEVWPADQVPIAVLHTCALPLQDLGADGVFKTWAGQYNAYQSKFRTGRPSLTWHELSTFMGLTDQVGERVLFTNCDDLPEGDRALSPPAAHYVASCCMEFPTAFGNRWK